MKKVLYLLGGLMLSAFAHADDAGAASSSGLGIGISAGTTGFGVQAGYGLGDNFAVRGLLSTFSYSTNGNLDGFSYDGKLKLNTAGVYGDWFPFSGVFRLTAGVVYNNSTIDLTGNPEGATYTINGNSYPSSSVNSVSGTMTFNKMAPYLGLGWGHIGHSGFNVTADLGVLFTGKPTVSVSGSCGSTAPTGSPVCNQIQADIAAEQAQLQSDASKYRYFPVASLGLGYTF